MSTRTDAVIRIAVENVADDFMQSLGTEEIQAIEKGEVSTSEIAMRFEEAIEAWLKE